MSTPNKPNKKYDPPSPLCSIAGHERKLGEDKPKTVACICKANDPINEQRKTVVSALQAKTRDVATSPPTSVKQRTPSALKSPKVVIDGQHFSFEADTKVQCSPRKASDAHKLVTATPEVNKLSPAKLPNNTAMPTSSPRMLEKSNSLGESRPQRQLRTTRSLSPRPPVRHQHSIMVCDENDVVSIKLSPHEDFDDVFNKNKVNAVRSACASPKFSTPSSLKIQYKQQQNKSTSCLEYIPTDPWKKMATGDAKPLAEVKKSMGKKSMSRPNLEHCVAKSHEAGTGDPWIWRSTSNITDTVDGDGGKNAANKKLKEQTNSLSATIDSNKQTRPKLQRSKSPVCPDDIALDTGMNKTKSISSIKMDGSQQSPATLKYQADAYNQAKYNNNNNIVSPIKPGRKTNTSNLSLDKKSPATLNVLNQNLLQPRHSFSASTNHQPMHDDELTLNCRRLSEQQIKYTTNYFNFNKAELQQQQQRTEAATIKHVKGGGEKTNSNTMTAKNELLETTC